MGGVKESFWRKPTLGKCPKCNRDVCTCPKCNGLCKCDKDGVKLFIKKLGESEIGRSIGRKFTRI